MEICKIRDDSVCKNEMFGNAVKIRENRNKDKGLSFRENKSREEHR